MFWARLRKSRPEADRLQPSPGDNITEFVPRTEIFGAQPELAAESDKPQVTAQEMQRILEQERFAVAGRLAVSIAHEINTPLQTIQTDLELLRSLPPEEQACLLDDAIDEIQRIGRIVHQLLDLYRPAVAGPVDLSSLIDRVVFMLSKRMEDQHILVRRTVSIALPAYGRADELMQIVINLVVNALDAMPAGGVLSFCVTTGGDGCAQLILDISDSGSGVPADLRARIFEPFVTTKATGMGLGLAISRQIAEQNNGELTLADSSEHGSTFRVRLPVFAAEVSARS
jgi:signal transduction histidine kinase